jgi:hypothetical protein
MSRVPRALLPRASTSRGVREKVATAKSTQVPPAPPSTKLSDQLKAILGTFGVVPASEYDQVRALVDAELTRIQIPATFISLRHGELLLGASQQGAALLRYDTQRLQAQIEEALPGLVTTVRVRTLRGG